MDKTLHADFPEFETNQDIKPIIAPLVYIKKKEFSQNMEGVA